MDKKKGENGEREDKSNLQNPTRANFSKGAKEEK